jgi:hypothetical protein
MTSPEQVTAAAVQSAINQRVEQAVNAAMQQMQLHLQQQQTPAPPPQQPNIQVNAVAVKLPEFWAADPSTWFRQAEAAFRRSNITVSSTMYDHVLMKLPQDVVMSVRDLANSIETTTPNPYKLLKARLTDCYAKTRWQQCFALLDLPALGDRRPSHLMNEMLALLPTGRNRDDTIFLGIFLRRLPVSMRDHLAAGDFQTAAEMARPADVLWDARCGESTVSVIADDHASNANLAAISPATGSSRDSRRRSPVCAAAPDRTAVRLQVRTAAATRPCATITAGSAGRRTSARPPAPGRKTRPPP